MDVAGAFVLPGLIDVHVHSEDWHAPLFLANGVTTVRDVGCSLDQVIARREAWNRPDACAPRLVCTGPLLDGASGKSWTGMAWIIRTPQEARIQVDRLVDAGVDQIKIYAGLDRPCTLAVLEGAQRHGRFTVAHLQDHMDAAEAIAAGLDEIEHLSGFAEALWPERHAAGEHWLDLWPDLEPERVQRLLDAATRSGTWLAPTRIVWKRITDAGDPRHLRHRQFAYAPAELRAWWDELYGAPAQSAERLRRTRALAAMQIMTAYLVESGARIVTGSDAPFCHVMPGFGLVDELALLVDCGMPPARCLRAATRDVAVALQMEDRIGTIEKGREADLVVVGDDPSVDIHALRDIALVIRGGTRLKPQELLDTARAARLPRPPRRFSDDY